MFKWCNDAFSFLPSFLRHTATFKIPSDIGETRTLFYIRGILREFSFYSKKHLWVFIRTVSHNIYSRGDTLKIILNNYQISGALHQRLVQMHRWAGGFAPSPVRYPPNAFFSWSALNSPICEKLHLSDWQVLGVVV